MDPEALGPGAETSAQNMTALSEIFAIVQQLSSQIDESRVRNVVEAVDSLAKSDIQSIIDLLSIALEKHHHLLVNADRVLNLLTEITSSTNTVARNRTLNFEHLALGTSPGVYTVLGESPTCVRVIKGETPGVFSKALINWAHLSHPNIVPVYGVFLNGTDGPISFLSPVLVQRNIVDHAKTLFQVERMPLISDVMDGLCYLHHLNIVHGSLNPGSVLISEDGRASVTDIDGSSQTFAVRYMAPEVLESEDTLTTKYADVWALGCLCYEVLSGNVPYCQLRQEKVVAAVVTRKQPSRPGQQGFKGEEINDVTWRPVSACWEFEPEDRPSCLKLRDAFVSMNIHDNRPPPQQSSGLGRVEAPAIDLENIRSLLNRVLGSDRLFPPPSQIPDQFRDLLFGLADNLSIAYSVAAAAKKLNPADSQSLLDALDLLVEENPSFAIAFNPIMELMETLMSSTHIYPQRYELRRIRYDPTLIEEDSFGEVYKGRDLNVRVNVVTNSNYVARIFNRLAKWAHSSHPNVLPFYGVFNETVNDVPRLCIVSPLMKNGTLLEYAPSLPQKSRISLISDVIDGLGYLHSTLLRLDLLRPDIVLISDDGRALIATFNITLIVTCTAAAKAIRSSTSRAICFQAPELFKTQQGSFESDIWSFGCLCYEVLSGKAPYHQYAEKTEIESALTRGEPPKRPSNEDDDIEMIDDPLWELTIGCCKPEYDDRLTVPQIQELIENLGMQGKRPDANKLPGTTIMSLRKHPDIEWDRVKQLLGQIQVELLRSPLSKLIQNHVKDVVAEVVNLHPSDIQTLVDFLDVTLKDHLTISEERNRVLAVLSRVMTSAQVFPQRHEMKGIRYDPRPIAEGGFGKVHRGSSNPNICVKVTTRVDEHALVAYIRELVLWAHSSHPNVLPFYGVFFDESRQICLTSPYMTKGNLTDYARQLPQSSRVPLLLDTIKGLDYLHGLGIVHTDLKGENVLISDEGRGLITDFGASHIVTATAKGAVTAASVATTLRFTAPEIIQDQTRRVRPSKECDIWSFGCLCYQVLSRKLPYYEFRLDAQVLAALFREQLPKRPGPVKNDADENSDDDEDDFDEKDWDDLDDTIWNLIMKCLVPKPENRPSASQIEELIIDLKAWDPRPAAKADMPGAEIIKQKSNVEVNLSRVGVLLEQLQILFLARSIYKYSDQDIVTAVSKLNREDSDYIQDFWASVLNRHLSTIEDRSRILATSSAVITSRLWVPLGYNFMVRPKYHLKAFAEGSFGRAYRDSKLDICVKVAQWQGMSPGLQKQWLGTLAPWAHSAHPNILPFYGVSLKGILSLVSPFIQNGNLHNYAAGLPQESRLLLILDVIEGLTYLHKLGIIHGNLKTQNVLVSDEGRGLITDFRPYHVNVAAAADGPTGSFITSTLRFTAPELVKNNQMLPTAASDVWSVGCLFYEVLSRKVPYYKYTEDSEIRAALSRDELPTRPVLSDGGTDEIDVVPWDLIQQCCASESSIRPKLGDIQEWLSNRHLEDNRPAAKSLPGAEIMKELTKYQDIEISQVREVLAKLKTHLPEVTPDGEKGSGNQD